MAPVPPEYESWAKGMIRNFMKENEALIAKPTFWSNVQGFYHAIRWSEPWIVGILTLHAVVLATVVLTRRIPNLQIALLLWICGMVFLAQYINPFGAQHWRALGFTQNYFDERGVFISAVYSAPLLLIAGGQMLYAFKKASSLLIKVKRAELSAKRKAQQSGDEKPKDPQRLKKTE